MASVPAMSSAVRHRSALWRRLVILPLMLTGAGVALLSPVIEAHAQEIGPGAGQDSGQPTGIITHRDVPVRHAVQPGVPADPAVVRTDGATELFGALALGLSPITDGEAGEVTAGIRPSIDRAGSSVDAVMAGVRGSVDAALAGVGAGPGDTPGGAAGGVGGLVDGAVGQIGQTISGVMGSIPATPGGPGAGGGR